MTISIQNRPCSLALVICCTITASVFSQNPGYQSGPGSGGGFAELVGLPAQVQAPSLAGPAPGELGPVQSDPFHTPASATAQLDTEIDVPLTRSFEGITDTGWTPPDPIIAAGPDHLVAATNAHVAYYTKQGVKISQTAATTLFGTLATGFRLFDPWVIYDQWVNRYMVLFTSQSTSGPNRSRYFLAISRTNDPTSGWYLYWFDNTLDGSTPTTNWSDYPRLATDKNAIYITGNMFAFGGGFQYAKVRILQRKAALVAGTADTSWWDFWNISIDGASTLAFTIQPCHDYDNKATNASAYFVSSINGSGSNLYFYAIKDVLNRTTPTPSMQKTRVAVAAYKSPGNSSQRGGSTLVENVAPRLMNAVRRNGSIWTAHSVALASGAGAGAQWYEVKHNSWPTSGSVTVRQQQLFWGGTDYHYTFPSVAVNQNNDMSMVFCRSHTTAEYVGCRMTGRLGTAALNTLDGSVEVKAGEAYYVRLANSRNRWGDYLGNSVDPQGNFWFMGQFAKPGNKWSTWIGHTRTVPVSVYVPDATANAGGCNVIPFGHNSAGTWSNQKYQQLITAADLNNQQLTDICDLAFAPCVTGTRHFDRIQIRLAQTNQSALSTTFSANLDANALTVLDKSNFDWPQTADSWNPVSLDRTYRYDAARGANLVLEITVWGARLNTSSTVFPGHHTGDRPRVFAYNWTGSPTATGSSSTNAALKVEVLFQKAAAESYGISCRGSNNLMPTCSVSGTGRLGSNYAVSLANALPNANTFLSIGLARWNPPLDLRIIGASGCWMYFNNDLTVTARCDSAGRYSLALGVPATGPACVGVHFQFFPFDARANSLGLTTTNYVRLLTGY